MITPLLFSPYTVFNCICRKPYCISLWYWNIFFFSCWFCKALNIVG